MKKIAFIFTHTPHGSSLGREGLDAVLATSALIDDITLFFIGDGIFQLLKHQQPDVILARNYIATFGALQFYDISHCYLCSDSCNERGLSKGEWVIDIQQLSRVDIQKKLRHFDTIFTC